MSGYLWKSFLEDDVDSFRHVLANSAHAVRPGTQRSFVGWQGGSFGATVNSSPGSYTPSPGPNSKARRTPAQAPVSLSRSDINSRDSVGMTILHHVASSNSESALGFAQALLEHPFTDLYIQDAENGWTSLHRAFYFGNIAIARLILERDTRDIFGHGSSGHNQHARGLVKIKDKEGYGPLDLYALTIKDRTLRPEDIAEDDSDSDDEVAHGHTGDKDEESRRHIVAPRTHLNGDEASTFGSNKNVTLGFGDEDDRQFPERIVLRRPDHLLQRFYEEHCEARARSREFTSSSGKGSSILPKAVSDLPVHIRNTPIVIQDMHMSKLHTAILTTDPVCNLYVCGHGPGGRLGTGDEMTRYQFTCIEGGGLSQKKIIAVALGQNHTLAITEEGETFSWGNNAFGQLGYSLPKPSIKDADPISTLPRQIFGPLKREVVTGIAASRIHSVVHSASSLYTFGKNEGQLGIVDSDARSLEMQTTPRKIAASLFSSSILSVSAIDGATICLLENREVWVFANYGYARLNFPLSGFTNYFLKESWLTTKYDAAPNKVNKITAAGDTICALTTSGEVFTVTLSRRSDGPQDTNTSTTNPKQIRGALSQPHRIWSAKSAHMAARDVDVDQDGSIILATEAGSVWKRTKRATLKNATAAGTGEYKPKDYKFVRVSGLTRVIAVRSSGYGAYAAVKKDCDVTKTQIEVDPAALWDNIAPLLPFYELGRHGSDSFPGSMGRPSPISTLRSRAIQARDRLEDDIKDALRQSRMSDGTYDLELGTTLSDIRIPVHEFVLSGRSRVFRDIMLDFRSSDGQFEVPDLLKVTHDEGKPLVILQGVDFLTMLNLVMYAYTESVLDVWNHTRSHPEMAARYRSVRAEVMKLASRLELSRLETAARQMVEPIRSMNLDFANALQDPSYFDSGDIIVELEDGEMTLHSALLCQRCPFFDGMFRGRARGQWLAGRRTEGSLLRVDLTHLETHLFELVVRHMYTDAGEEIFDDVTSEDLNDFLALEELFDHVMEVMSIANELMIDRLSQICQRLIGRYVNARNVCSLLNAIAPSSVSEFKDAALEYVCLCLEAVLQNGSLDELDEDLLAELDEIVRGNQLATLPFARSGRANTLLFDKYPELAERIERGKRAKIDAIVLSNKFADNEGVAGSSFRAQSLEELSTSPLRQRMRRKASREAGAVESPAMTPQLRGKGSVPDLMFDMSDGDDETALDEPIRPPVFSDKKSVKMGATEMLLGSPEATIPGSGLRSATSPAQTPTSMPGLKTIPAQPREPGRPWGTAPLEATKLDFKDIMSQASTDSPSNLTLGLRAQSKAEAAGSFHQKISQKERKRRQQAQLGQGQETAQPAAPTVSPWQAMSHRKPSVTASSPAPTPPPQPARSPSTPQLTMRQTVANGGAASKKKDAQTPNKSAKSTVDSVLKLQSRPASASGPGMAVDTTPIPNPRSVRHIPLPSHSPGAEELHLTMEEILSLQQAEKQYIKDAAAKRSLQEIQQEQEFQQWWDQESKKVMQEEEQRKRAEERAARAARGRGRSSRGRGKGREKKDNVEGEARSKGHKDAGPASTAAESSTNAAPRQEGGDRGRGKGRHRGNRGGGGGGRGGKSQGPAKGHTAAPPSAAGGNAT